MDQKTMARMQVFQRSEEPLGISCGLEEFAVAFPESRQDVLEMLESFSGDEEKPESALKETAERIAAIGMLEILCGK